MEHLTPQELAAEVKQRFDSKFGEHGARLDELEQKTDRRGAGGGEYQPSTPGQQFVDSEEFKSLGSNLHGGRRVACEVKAVITSATADANGSAGALLSPYYDATLPLPRRQMTIRDLIPVIQVTTGSVEYARQTGFTNAAAMVAEGALKPESDIKYDLVNVPVRTVAHWVIASVQILADAPQLRGLIDTDLTYGLKYVEEAQLLNGDGIGTNLSGIVTQATAFAAGTRIISSPNKIDVINAAIYQQNLTNLPATFIVIHPSDWTDIVATKDSSGRYIVGDPAAALQPQLFSLPVLRTEAMGIGKFLVGNGPSATIYSRQTATVEISTEDRDNFIRNLCTVRAESRLGFAVKSGLGFTYGDFAAAITDLTT
jgi:HK97 family phage major capsid protein